MAEKEREPKRQEEYRGTKVVEQLTDKEPGLEPVPLLESFIAPVRTYKNVAQKLLSAGGATKAVGKEAKFAKGGKVSGASRRGDGCAQRGRTRGKVY